MSAIGLKWLSIARYYNATLFRIGLRVKLKFSFFRIAHLGDLRLLHCHATTLFVMKYQGITSHNGSMKLDAHWVYGRILSLQRTKGVLRN